MKKLIFLIVALLMVIQSFAQLSPVKVTRIANATTAFGENISVGTLVYDVNAEQLWQATAGVASTATLTTAAASFILTNSDGITNLAEGSTTNTTVEITSSTGTNATLQSASTSRAGLMSKAKFDEVEANTSAIANLPDVAIIDNAGTPELATGITQGELQTAIGVDPSGTDNSIDVTLAGSYDYLTLSGQEITMGQIDYTTDISNIPTDGVTAAGSGLTKTGNTIKLGGDITENTSLKSFTQNMISIGTSDGLADASLLQMNGALNTTVLTVGDGIGTSASVNLDQDKVVISAQQLGSGNSITVNRSDIDIDGRMEYADDYSGAYTNRSLVDKGFTEATYAKPGDVSTNEINDLSASVTWTNVPDVNITQSSVTQHQAALSVTASQVSDFDTEVANNTAVAANTAKETNVSTSLSIGTKGANTLGISSDGGTDDVVLPAVTTSEAGVMTAADKTKLDGITAGASVTNVSSATTAQLTVANGGTTPTLSIVTGAVTNGGTALATGDQIYDFTTAITDALDSDITAVENDLATNYVPNTAKGANNGVAELDGTGKVPTSQLPDAVLGAVSYQGTWNANTNDPSLSSGTGTKGYYYTVVTGGSTNLDGISDWEQGDMAIYNGTAWEKIDNNNDVLTVNGQTGTVVLDQDDVGDGTTYVRTENNYTDAEKTKLGNIEAGAQVNYQMKNETFEENDGTPTAHSLAETAITTGATVSVNGTVVPPSAYNLTGSTVTLTIPVVQYDQVVITYLY